MLCGLISSDKAIFIIIFMLLLQPVYLLKKNCDGQIRTDEL